MLAKKCNRVTVLFYVNFATSKISILAKDVTNKNSIDSIIAYIGEEKKDSICYHFFENPIGEINFYEDTAMIRGLISMDFILEGKCRGFYPVNEKIYPRFEITPFGKTTLENLKNKFKLHL